MSPYILADIDPRPWGETVSNLSAAALVLLAVALVFGFTLLLWRGSEKLGIPGAGVELRLAREALVKDREAELEERRKEREAFVAHFKSAEESDKRLRRDFRAVMAWIATTLGAEPPDLDPPDDSDPSIAPPPLPSTRSASDAGTGSRPRGPSERREAGPRSSRRA